MAGLGRVLTISSCPICVHLRSSAANLCPRATMTPPTIDPIAMLRPRRKITGMSAILLPFTESGEIDWPGFTAHAERTAAAGLTPAVNMDTGFGNLLDEP